MFWIASAVTALITGAILIDWSQLRRLLPTAMAAVLLSGAQAALPDALASHSLLEQPGGPHRWVLILIAQYSVAPVLAALYAQGLSAAACAVGRPSVVPPAARTLLFMLVTITYVALASRAGALAIRGSALRCTIEVALFYGLLWQVHTYGGSSRLTGLARAEVG